jgi:hypothetical protein
MRPRPYLRAYMAGIVVPTLFLIVIMLIDAYHVFYFEVPSQFVFGLPSRPLERTILFPMAVVPNLWGVWNMLYLATKSRTHLPLGVHGSLLVALIVPAGILLGRALDLFAIQLSYALPVIPVGMVVYYLAWKFFVGSLNQEMGIA